MCKLQIVDCITVGFHISTDIQQFLPDLELSAVILASNIFPGRYDERQQVKIPRASLSDSSGI